jgi:hypothetical protein
VVVLGGLAEREQVYLSIPSGMEEDAVVLLPELNGKRLKKNGQNYSETPREVAAAGHL